MKSVGVFIFSFLLFINAPLVLSEVYKWVDKNGKTHYGDKPKNSESVEIKIKSEPIPQSDLVERQQKREKLLKIYEEEREQKKDEKVLAKEKREERKKQCKNARVELIDYQRGGQLLYELDENGDRYFLTDEDRQERQEYWQSEVDRLCLDKWLKD